jgi:alkanesulfonate monooxygenase SsuD/methylene tetrahydromethanopterin reductase-like flavin-dependent oxidoreductase (luciferase family)
MTVHVPLLHPLYAAKALATVDHISHGRAGLNIVCGWNPDEFDMFGVTLVKDAYVQAKEWIDVIVQTYNSDKPVDFNGVHYQLKGAVSRPASLQRPRPVTMNAAFGPPGRDFAAQNCDRRHQGPGRKIRTRRRRVHYRSRRLPPDAKRGRGLLRLLFAAEYRRGSRRLSHAAEEEFQSQPRGRSVQAI